MSAASKAQVDQIDALLRDMTPAQLAKVIDVCLHQASDIAMALSSLGPFGPMGSRIAMLTALSAMAASRITKPEPLSPELASEFYAVLQRLGGAS